MNEHKNLNGLIGAEESKRLMGQLQRGASRRGREVWRRGAQLGHRGMCAAMMSVP